MVEASHLQASIQNERKRGPRNARRATHLEQHPILAQILASSRVTSGSNPRPEPRTSHEPRGAVNCVLTGRADATARAQNQPQGSALQGQRIRADKKRAHNLKHIISWWVQRGIAKLSKWPTNIYVRHSRKNKYIYFYIYVKPFLMFIFFYLNCYLYFTLFYSNTCYEHDFPRLIDFKVDTCKNVFFKKLVLEKMAFFL